MNGIRLRSAVPADAATLLRWRNDPWILAHGAQGRAVDAAEHADWFARTIASPDHLLLIVESVAGGGIGSLRFDRESPAAAAVSIYLLQEHAGRGHGVAALRAACPLAFETWPEVERILARVLPVNARSLRAFEKAGFIAPHRRENEREGRDVVTLTLSRRAWFARPGPTTAGQPAAR